MALYLTTQGAAALKVELRRLLHTDRPHMVDQVATAAAHGDRSENAEYIYGKKKLRAIDRRIRFLTKRLEAAVVVDPTIDRGDKVFFGATVVLEDDDGRVQELQLVGQDELDETGTRLSWRSPVGKALLGRDVDDEVPVVTPSGQRVLTILEVRYE